MNHSACSSLHEGDGRIALVVAIDAALMDLSIHRNDSRPRQPQWRASPWDCILHLDGNRYNSPRSLVDRSMQHNQENVRRNLCHHTTGVPADAARRECTRDATSMPIVLQTHTVEAQRGTPSEASLKNSSRVESVCASIHRKPSFH